MCVCVFRLQPIAGGAAGSFLLVLGCPQTPVSGQRWKHVGGMAVDGGQTREQKTFALLPLCPKWVPTRRTLPLLILAMARPSQHPLTQALPASGSRTASLSHDHLVCAVQTASACFRFIDSMAAKPRFICLHKRD